MLPLLAAVFRAAIDSVNFSIFIHGLTGSFKTEVALLMAQFFGPGLTTADIHGWNSTAIALAALAFQAKNLVWPVDDFVLSGSLGDMQRKNRQADDLLRAQGNRAGRNRARGDGSVRQGKPPRGLLLCTGEMLPEGQSLNARYLAIEINEGEILDRGDPEKMALINEVQATARGGAPAQVMASLLTWVAPQYDTIRQDMHEQKAKFREVFCEEGLHARTVDIAADLLAGLDVFLYFAEEAGAIDSTCSDLLWERYHDAAWTLLKAQREQQFSEDPVNRYLELLASALHSGRAHLRLLQPDDEDAKDTLWSPALWGHREKIVRIPRISRDGDEDAEQELPTDFDEKSIWVERGPQVGFKEFDTVYIDPEASLAAVNRFAHELGVGAIPFGRKTLGKRLRREGLLLGHDKDRNTLKRNIDGVRREVFHLRIRGFIEEFMPESDFILASDEEVEEERLRFKGREEAYQAALRERRERRDQRNMQAWSKLLRR